MNQADHGSAQYYHHDGEYAELFFLFLSPFFAPGK
jgi:hypothetical protein